METKASNRKRVQSSFQKLSNLQKRVNRYKAQGLPTQKEAMHLRTIALTTSYIERISDPNKPPITLSKFCKENQISETTIRKGLKELTGMATKNNNPNSNNIKTYQNNIKHIKSRIVEVGINNLLPEELEFYKKWQESDKKRANKIQEKKKEKMVSNDLATLCKAQLSIKETSEAINIKAKKNNLKGGSKEQELDDYEEEELDDEEFKQMAIQNLKINTRSIKTKTNNDDE